MEITGNRPRGLSIERSGNSCMGCREKPYPPAGVSATSASKLVQYIKGNTSRKLQMEYKELK